MTLRTRFIALLVIMLVVPMLLSQGFLLQRIFVIQEQTHRDRLRALAEEASENLNTLQRQALFSSQLIAQSSALSLYLDNQRYRLPEAVAYRLLLKTFANHLRSDKNHRRIYLLRNDGTIDTQFDLSGTLPTHETLPDFFRFEQQKAAGAHTFFWYSTQEEPGKLRLMVAHAIRDMTESSITRHQQGTLRGHVVISVVLDHLKHFEPSISSPVHSRVADHRPDGLSDISQDDSNSGDRNVMLLLKYQGKPWLKTAALGDSLLDASRSGLLRNSPTREINGEHFLLEYIDHPPEISIEAWLPRAQLYAEAMPAMLQNLGISIFEITLVGLLFYVVLNRRLITPLQNAQSLTRQIRNGQWLKRHSSSPETQHSNDEVHRLVNALYDMSESLEQTSTALEHKRIQAEQAERLKTEFLANISHEIRTPVNIIVGIMARLEKTIDEPRQKEAMGLAKNEALRLVKSIDELILLADIETRKHQLNPREFYLPDLLQRCVESASVPAQNKGLSLHTAIGAESRMLVMSDADALGKIIDILLDNAIKFTDRGTVTLMARCTENGAGIRLDITVSDTGPGIATDAVPTLGEAFRQVDGSRSRQHGGIGIGLAICKGLLSLYGSALEVDSTPGQGSMFRFSVQLALPGSRSR